MSSRVSHAQFLRICHYMMAFPDYVESHTMEEMSTAYSNDFGFPITESTIRDAMKECRFTNGVSKETALVERLKKLIG